MAGSSRSAARGFIVLIAAGLIGACEMLGFGGDDSTTAAPAPTAEITLTHAAAICEAAFVNTAIRAGHTDFHVASAFLAQSQRISGDEEYIVSGHIRGQSGQYWPVTAICAINTRAGVDETWMPNIGAVSNFHIVHEPTESTHQQRLRDGVFAGVIGP